MGVKQLYMIVLQCGLDWEGEREAHICKDVVYDFIVSNEIAEMSSRASLVSCAFWDIQIQKCKKCKRKRWLYT